MKTKIVYVLTSGENDFYAEQMLMSVYSLKYYNPNAKVELIVDSCTKRSVDNRLPKLYDYVDNIVSVNFEESVTNAYRSRFLKTSSRLYVKGDYLFIDTDTIINGDISDIDNLKVGIGAVKDLHQDTLRNARYLDLLMLKVKKLGWNAFDLDVEYFNSGVLYVKDTPEVHLFFNEWHKKWLESFDRGVPQDQPSLAMVNQQFQLIQNIPSKWHCQLFGNGLRYLKDARIIHYFNALNSELGGERPLVFMNDDFLLKIKNDQGLNDEVKNIIINLDKSFASQIHIISGNALKLSDTTAYEVLLSIFGKHKKVFKMIENILDKIFAIKKKFF